jgi:hypothetical protein
MTTSDPTDRDPADRDPGVGGPGDPDGRDDDLVAHLRALAAAADPVPGDLTLTARTALGLHGFDAALARLIESDDRELAGARSTAGASLLAFECDGCVIEVEVSGVADGVRLVGQAATDPPPSALALECPDTQATDVVVDDAGRFDVTSAPGPARLVLRYPERAPIVTDWVTL